VTASTNGTFKWIASLLAGLVAGFGGTIWVAADKPSAEQVEKMVKTGVENGPYMKAAGVLNKGITMNEKEIIKNAKAIDENGDAIEEVKDTVNEMRVQQRIDTQRIISEIRKGQ